MPVCNILPTEFPHHCVPPLDTPLTQLGAVQSNHTSIKKRQTSYRSIFPFRQFSSGVRHCRYYALLLPSLYSPEDSFQVRKHCYRLSIAISYRSFAIQCLLPMKETKRKTKSKRFAHIPFWELRHWVSKSMSPNQ